MSEIVPGNVNLPGVGPQKAVAHPQRGGFARAVGPEQPQHFARAARQVDTLDDAFAAEGFYETGRFEDKMMSHGGVSESASTAESVPLPEPRSIGRQWIRRRPSLVRAGV